MKFVILLILLGRVVARKNRQRMGSFRKFHKEHGNKRSAQTVTFTKAETELFDRIQAMKSRQQFFTQFAQNRAVSDLHQRAFDTYYAHYFGKLSGFGQKATK